MKRNVPRSVLALITTVCMAASLNANAAPNKNGSLEVLSDAEVADLIFMREEEKMARDSYLELYDQWGLLVFANIAKSEQRHMDAMENLIAKYGLVDPVADEAVVGELTDPVLAFLYEDLMSLGSQSMMDGLIVGAMIEETDIEDIQRAISQTSHDDIAAAYENLMCGSRNHLRAFVGQIELNGGEYSPTVLSEEAFLAIVESPVERGCGYSNRRAGKGQVKLGVNGRY